MTATTETLTPLSERRSWLTGARLVLAATVAIAAMKLQALPLDAPMAKRAALTYGAFALAIEVWCRIRRARELNWLSISLTVDGVFLAAVMAGSGNPIGPWLVVMCIHITATTLLLSYRSGLKIAAWNSFLVVMMHALAEQGAFDNLQANYALLSDNASDTNAAFACTLLWAAAITTAAGSAINERELRRRRGESVLLATVSERIGSLGRTHDLLDLLIATTVDEIGFKQAVTFTPTGIEQWELRRRESYHRSGIDVELFGPAVEQAFMTKAPLLVRNLDLDEHPAIAEALPGATDVLIQPMIADGEVLALFVAEWVNPRHVIERETISLVSNLSGRTALALRNVMLIEEVRQLAETDELTKLPNRRAFDHVLDRELARAHTQNETLVLALFDIDHFKQVNDNFGHQVGDAVLRAVSKSLMGACRSNDFPARYGGEEIAVIMRQKDLYSIFDAIERLRKEMSRAEGPISITASAGVACFPHDGVTAAQLIASADKALYRAKHNGRNQTFIAG